MTLVVLSVNVAQQPKRIPGAIGDQNGRAKELIAQILDVDPDIVCLQELFRKKSRQIVYDGLKSRFPYCYLDTACGKYIIGVNSGLGIFSKYPLSNKELLPYKVYRGVANFAKKSLMHTTVHISESQTIELFTTHLQAGIGAEPCICKLFDKNEYSSDKLKSMQIKELIDWTIAGKYTEKPMIFTGDFNIRAGTTLYTTVEEELDNSLQIKDVFDPEVSLCDSSVVGKPDRRIDYVWTNIDDSYYIILEPWTMSISKYVTDHHAIVGFIQLEK